MAGEGTRGTGRVVNWSARCKDCLRRGDEATFTYPDDWRASVQDLGGGTSDRCPACRRRHASAIRSIAVPYIDIDTVADVVDTANPTGPLGGLGPLPAPHEQTEVRTDLDAIEFGLTDADVLDILEALEHHRVVVVIAGTGSGKSTFLPYRLLYPPEGARIRLSRRGRIVVTEPRREATQGTATMVAQVLCGSPEPGAGSPVGFKMKDVDKTDPSNRLVYVTDGTMIHWLGDGTLDTVSTLIIDEAHELNKNIEMALAYLAGNLERYPHLRIIIASATISPEPFVHQFGGPSKVAVREFASAVKSIGFGHPLWPGEPFDPGDPAWAHDHWRGVDLDGRPLVEVARELAELRLPDPPEPGRDFRTWQDKMPGRAVDQVVKLLEGTDDGDIIVFLHGLKPIEEVDGKLRRWLAEHHLERVHVLRFTRETPDRLKAKVRADARAGHRRVILATNIAETSLTLDGLRFVIDTGLINQTRWDPVTASQRVVPTGHSQFGIRQRWGRVGRKVPGWVFPLYGRDQFQALPQSTAPEAARSGLEDVYLRLKSLGVADVEALPFVSQDPGAGGHGFAATFSAEIDRAARSLRQRGALSTDGVLTERGRTLARASDPRGGAVLVAERLACAVEVATVLSLLGRAAVVGGLIPFTSRWSPARRLALVRHHRSLAAGAADDLELALTAFWEWQRIPSADRGEWCKDQWIDEAFLKAADDGRTKLLRPLRAKTRDADAPIRSLQLDLLPRARSVLAFSLPDLIVTKDGDRWLDDQEREVTFDRGTIVGPNARRVISLSRSQYGGAIRCAGTVWVDDVVAADDECGLLAAVPLVDPVGGEAAAAFRAARAEARRLAPVGARMRRAVDRDEGGIWRIPPPPPGDGEHAEEGDAAAFEHDDESVNEPDGAAIVQPGTATIEGER